ncbi:DMT superfamily metabolite exporter [Halolactibacillus alkaliphilus]|uniref:DMT superfamily metabolite exporter n=1 Tax=Halolactibacillus alkaliphilus TaxID=442899 RepID=A0A511WX08_9BACI|nr:DMT family transporter [Halolactibacillus alkaliphilus]GEN55649.1 DMT superfamily metabolite exporter [Halolactibacillus alkaliphilus]GGN63589.1 DMT superfamily metabolite exporter [Halolactibacillus alkaliphilus]SFO62787.1 Permease of the drug/metabolite transporter (DMT) superfamily [Halolactibacillus alkaliphilus]
MRKLLMRPSIAISVAILCSVLWGSAFPVLKVSYTELQMSPDDVIAKMVFAGLRFLLAGILVLIFLFFMDRQAIKITKRQFTVLLILGVIQTAFQYYFFYNGLARVTGMQGAILSSGGIFFTIVAAHIYYKDDRLSTQKMIGLIAGFGGIVLANWGQSLSLSFQWDGEGFMLMAGVTSAIATIMAKELATGIHPFAITGWQLTLGAVALLLIGYPQLDAGAIQYNALGSGLLIYSAFLSAIAFALWYSLLKYHQAGRISMYKFITPVSGVLLSAVFIPGEVLTPMLIVAFMLVAFGIVVVNRK